MSDATGTAVAVQEQPMAAAAVALRDHATQIEEWAFNLSQAYQIAVRLVTTSFVPKTYSGRPEEAAAAIMTGQELGMSPLASLRSIDIIGGVPAMRAIALRALVQSKGHEIWTEESTATQAIVAGRRKGSDKVERSVWTMDRARELKLAAKDNWKNQPIAMLLARATSELVRLIAADVILGIPYSVEEVEDLGVVDAKPAVADAPRQSAGRSVKRQAIRKPETAPQPEDQQREPEDEQSSEPVDEHAVKAGVEKLEASVPFEGDPSQPTAEELAEWGALPMDGE